MPGLRHFLGALLAAAFLAAQQAALEHPLWHVAAAEDTKKSDPARAPLCDQHSALGAVLGAIGCADRAIANESPAAPALAVIAALAASPASLTPSSRGPPSLL